MKPQSVIALQIFFNYDNDMCIRELMAIKHAIGRKFFPVMHDKRHIAFVMLSEESPSALVERLRSVLEVNAISNYWAFIPTSNIAGKFGGLDSFVTRVKAAYALAYNRAKPKNVSYLEPTISKRRHHNAVGQMPVKLGRDRQMPKNPNRK